MQVKEEADAPKRRRKEQGAGEEPPRKKKKPRAAAVEERPRRAAAARVRLLPALSLGATMHSAIVTASHAAPVTQHCGKSDHMQQISFCKRKEEEHACMRACRRRTRA